MIKNKFPALSAAAVTLLAFAALTFKTDNQINSTAYALKTGKPLYTDVSLTNLPIGVVSGPGMDVESADLDNDGDPDILIAQEYQPNIMLLNNGSGIFTNGTPGRIPQRFLDHEDIAIADMDSDNDLDIAFAVEDHAVHELCFNNGNAVYREMNGVLPGSIANSVWAEDVNNDQLPDLIFGNAGPNDMPAQNFLLINNGDSTFSNQTSTRLPQVLDITQDIKLADIDDDGDNDMIVGNEDGNKIHINNGSGFFTDETSSRLPLTGTEETRKVTLGDVDGDDDLDIFFANVAFRAGRLRQDRLLLNNGSGIFTDVTASNLPVDQEHTTDGIFVDVDFDNDIDLVTANIFNNRPVKVFLNDGSGVFEERTPEVLPPGVLGEGIGLKAEDFNGDNLLDIYICNRGGMDRLLFRNDTAVIGINQVGSETPKGFALHQNFPNPFNPVTNIMFEVPKNGNVKLTIFDPAGKTAAGIINKYLSAGIYTVDWDASSFPSGIYFYRMESGPFTETKKMILIK